MDGRRLWVWHPHTSLSADSCWGRKKRQFGCLRLIVVVIRQPFNSSLSVSQETIFETLGLWLISIKWKHLTPSCSSVQTAKEMFFFSSTYLLLSIWHSSHLLEILENAWTSMFFSRPEKCAESAKTYIFWSTIPMYIVMVNSGKK